MAILDIQWENPYFGIENNYVGIFPPSYAVIPLFISSFTTFHYLDPYTSLGKKNKIILSKLFYTKFFSTIFNSDNE